MGIYDGATAFSSRKRVWWRTSLGIIATVVVLGYAYANLRRPSNLDALAVASAVPDGGGYCDLRETGVPEPVIHNGFTILRASNGGTYCCGFTFYVAMKVAERRGLLRDKEIHEIKRFQREWYGATNQSAETQLALAMTNLGIGRQIHPRDAQPGDFVAFQRSGGAGHSVIFLEWIYEGNIIVGLRYRSSQPTTGGVGNQEEYFTTSGRRYAFIDPARLYVARLH